MHSMILIAVTALTTILLRFLPFILFGKNTPGYITYLGKVLPQAIIGLLVIYCLKDVSFIEKPYGLPEVIAGLSVVGIQAWKRNAVISILGGTVIYMLLIRILV